MNELPLMEVPLTPEEDVIARLVEAAMIASTMPNAYMKDASAVLFVLIRSIGDGNTRELTKLVVSFLREHLVKLEFEKEEELFKNSSKETLRMYRYLKRKIRNLYGEKVNNA